MKWENIPQKVTSGLLLGLLIAALSWTGCGNGGNGDNGDRVTYNVRISRFTTTNLTDANADLILAEKGAILQNLDSPGDVACNVEFIRNGPVTTFALGNGSINSEADFVAVNGQPGQVKVVNQINWCGALIPNVIGCAPVPGPSLVVVRFTPSREGILWVHEFGHNKGLSHRNGNDLVMNPVIGSTKRSVNQAECDAYRQQSASP